MSNEKPLSTSEIAWLRKKYEEATKGVTTGVEVCALVKYSVGVSAISKFPNKEMLESLKASGAILDYQILE